MEVGKSHWLTLLDQIADKKASHVLPDRRKLTKKISSANTVRARPAGLEPDTDDARALKYLTARFSITESHSQGSRKKTTIE